MQSSKAVEVSGPVAPVVFSSDLRALPEVPPWKPGDLVKEVIQERSFDGTPPPNPPSEERSDPLLALQGGDAPGNVLTLGASFPGIAYSGSEPADTVGDVGLNHFIQAVNGSSGSLFQVFDKAGVALTGAIAMKSLGNGTCDLGWCDPVVQYDQLADRWLLSELSLEGFPASGTFCVYVSQTPDPVSGGWYAYEFATPNFPDFPKIGVWPDAYYMSTNELDGGNGINGAYALERDAMLAGTPATWQRFETPKLSGFYFHSLTVADLDGTESPPPGAPGLFLRHRDTEYHAGVSDPAGDYLEIWQLSVDWETPAGSTFIGPLLVPTSEFDSSVCSPDGGFYHCIDQPGEEVKLDARPEVLMWGLQYLNSESHQTLVGSFTVDVGNDHAGVRWFELRDGGTGWGVHQEGTFAPDDDHRWMSSIAMNRHGEIALGYNVSGETVFPGISVTGRGPADPSGSMGVPETHLREGTGVQTSTNRWGDYSAMAVGPRDRCAFWYTNQVVLASGVWQSQVGTFSFEACQTIFSDGFESGDLTGWSNF